MYGYEKIVAISRVEMCTYIQFICNKMDNLVHLERLKPRQDVIDFFACGSYIV